MSKSRKDLIPKCVTSNLTASPERFI